jgi:hypothetical protein
MITVRHPLNPKDYHIFTTDDAISGGIFGLNHFILNEDGALQDGPTRLGSFSTTEGIAATLHDNGLDIWVTVMATDGKFHAYLVTSAGVDHTPVISSSGTVHTVTNVAGTMKASPDGTKLAIVVRDNDAFELFDFDNTTGIASNPLSSDQVQKMKSVLCSGTCL